MNTAIAATMRSLRFPLKKDRKTKARMPEKIDDMHGAAACIAGMIRAAIHCRVTAETKMREAAICDDIDNAMSRRAANIARIEARRQRRTMRSHALWARVFADQVRDNDARLDAISQALTNDLVASFRASNLSERWRRVQAMKFNRGLTDGSRARIDRVLHAIAVKHDALNPYGHTLGYLTADRGAEPGAAPWRPLETAPRDGTTILLRCSKRPNQPVKAGWSEI